MTELDLEQFGVKQRLLLHGSIEACWTGGRRLVFLFGENHRDREMKRLYVSNACKLVDAGIVGCVGTEVPMADLDSQAVEFIATRSAELFAEHKTDEAVVDYLDRVQPAWYGILQFGNTLRVLRPSPPVRCVEDAVLRERMKPVSDAYCLWDLGAAPRASAHK
jgi:hypothetical protein